MRETLDQFEYYSALLVRLYNTPVCTMTVKEIRDHLDEILECTLQLDDHIGVMRKHVYPLLGAIDKCK